MGAYEDWLEGNLEVSEIPVTNIDEQAQIEQETNPVNPGPIANFYRTFVGGLRDSGQSKLNLMEDIADMEYPGLAPSINNPITLMQGANFLSKKLGGEDGLPEIPEPTYFGGSFARDIIQFLPDFVGFDKAIRGPQIAATQGPAFVRNLYNRLMVPQGKTDKVGAVKDIADRAVSDVVRYGTIGSIVEQTFDPEEERLSNLLYDTFGPDVFVVGPVAEYLKADPDDSVALSRFKMAIEGAGLGSLLSPIIGFLGRAFDIRSVKQQEAKIAENKKEQIFEEEFVGPRLPEEPPTSQSEKKL